MKLERSLPYFNAILKADSRKRMIILSSFPKFVIDDLAEVLLNVVMGRVDVCKGKHKQLKKHQNTLLEIASTKSKPKVRKILYKQNGGFLGALLPIVSSVIGLLASSA